MRLIFALFLLIVIYSHNTLYQASLCLAAIRHHERTGKGHFVNYDSLPESMWETIAPEYFGVSLSEEAIDNMKNISGVYAKGGKERNQREWDDEQVDEKVGTIDEKATKGGTRGFATIF